MARALDRINHPAPFQGFGHTMTPASYSYYMGHLNEEDPEYHFAAKQFLEQLQTLEKNPELFDQVVTPAMIEQAVLYSTANANCPVYKYAEELFDIIDRHPQLLEAAQKGVIEAMHGQLEPQKTRELQDVGKTCLARLAGDLARRESFAGFLNETAKTDATLAEALQPYVVSEAQALTPII